MKNKGLIHKNILMSITSLLGLIIISIIINIASVFYPGSALESALILRNDVSWRSMLLILLLSCTFSFLTSLIIFWLFNIRKYDDSVNNKAFEFSFKFTLTIVLVVALLLFFDKTQFGIIASGLSIWALLSTVFKNRS